MAKQSTIQHYSSTVTGNSPTAGSIITGELAINVADEKIFLKNLGGSIISLSQTKDLSGAFASSSKVVSSVNGATGAVTNVAKTNADNNFTASQTIQAINASLSVVDSTSSDRITLNPATNKIVFYDDNSGNEVQLYVSGFGNQLITFPDDTTTLAGRASDQTFTGTNTFNTRTKFVGGLTTSNLYVTNGATFAGNISAPNIVNSVNGLTGAITLTSGSNITLTPSGNTITIASTASGGGGATTSAKNTWTATQSFSAGLTFAGTLTGASGSTVSVTSVYASNLINTSEVQTNSIALKTAAPLLIGDYSQPITIGDYGPAQYGTRIELDDTIGISSIRLIAANGGVYLGDVYGDNSAATMSLAQTTITINPQSGVLAAGTQPYVTVNPSYLDFGTLTLTGGVGLFGRGITALERSHFRGGLSAANLYVAQGATFAGRIQGVGATFSGTVEIDTGLILPNNQNITSAVTTFNGASGAILYSPAIASSSVTGVASFGNEFIVTAAGAVGLTSNYVKTFNGLTGAITLTSGSNITLTTSGNQITVASTASGGGISRSISTITTSTSAGASSSYDYVYIGATSGNINLTLPTAVSNTNRYSVKQTNAIGTLTILTTSSQTIDGVTGFALNRQYQAVDLISDNANWNIL